MNTELTLMEQLYALLPVLMMGAMGLALIGLWAFCKSSTTTDNRDEFYKPRR